MLKKDWEIDQLFCNELTEYQEIPPLFVWSHIQAEMDMQRRTLILDRLKMVGVVAAVVIAFIAGSWITHFNLTKNNQLNYPLCQAVLKSDKKADTFSPKSSTDILPGDKGRGMAGRLGSSKSTASLTSLASFAVNPSFRDQGKSISSNSSQEVILSDTEKMFIDHLKENFKRVTKFTHWIDAMVGGTPVEEGSAGVESVASGSWKQPVPLESFDGNVYHLKPQMRRWSLSAGLAPSIGNQISDGHKDKNLLALLPNEVNYQCKTTEMALSGQLLAGYKIDKRLTIKGGVGLSRIHNVTNRVKIGTEMSQDEVSPVAMVSIPTGIVHLTHDNINDDTEMPQTSFDDNFLPQRITHNLDYLELPLVASYKIVKGKVNLSVSGGITTHILVGNRVFIPDERVMAASDGVNNIRPLVYSNSIGLQVEYELSNRVTLSLEPRIKHFMNSISKEQYINYKPYKTEVVTGLTYSFN